MVVYLQSFVLTGRSVDGARLWEREMDAQREAGAHGCCVDVWSVL